MPQYLTTLGAPRLVKLGSELWLADQKQVLAAYVHRYTGQHRPTWAGRSDCAKCPVQFRTDADWLANTFFAVTKSGRLNPRMKQCESHPTWPDNPELRKP